MFSMVYELRPNRLLAMSCVFLRLRTPGQKGVGGYPPVAPPFRVARVFVAQAIVPVRRAGQHRRLHRTTDRLTAGDYAMSLSCSITMRHNVRQRAQTGLSVLLDLRLVDAFYVEDAGLALDGYEDAVELAAVFDFEGDFCAGVEFFLARFEGADVGAGVADGGGDFGEHAGAVFCEDEEAGHELAFYGAGPFDVHAALGFVEEVLHVGATAVVDGYAAAAGDIADDFVTGNRVAALGAKDEQVVVAVHLDGGLAESQGFFDGGDELGRRLRSGVGKGLAQYFLQRLARREFSVAERGVEIFRARAAVIRRDLGDSLVVNALQAYAEVPGFFFQQFAAEVGGLVAFVQVDPVADFAAGARAAHEAEPVAAGRVVLLRDDLDHVAIRKRVTQRHHLAVHARADALVADFGMHGVGEVHGSGAARERDHFPLGREGVDLFGIQVHAQGGEELGGLLHLLHPLDELAHPDDALIVAAGDALAVLIFPVRGHALLGDAMHFLGADLDFEGLPGVDYRSVQ